MGTVVGLPWKHVFFFFCHSSQNAGGWGCGGMGACECVSPHSQNKKKSSFQARGPHLSCPAPSRPIHYKLSPICIPKPRWRRLKAESPQKKKEKKKQRWPTSPGFPPPSKLEIHTSFLWQELPSSIWQGGGDGRPVFRGQLAALYDALLTYWRRAVWWSERRVEGKADL